MLGTRPVTRVGQRHNEGSSELRARPDVAASQKATCLTSQGFWEAQWFVPGDAEFPVYTVENLSFGLNICTEKDARGVPVKERLWGSCSSSSPAAPRP
ncbi:MAG: hypothetical protein ACRERX_09030 [Pseudomonas sp.]